MAYRYKSPEEAVQAWLAKIDAELRELTARLDTYRDNPDLEWGDAGDLGRVYETLRWANFKED